MTIGAALADFPLLNGGTYVAEEFTPVEIPEKGVILASAMVAPTNLSTFTLVILTENRISVDVPVKLATGVKFAAGQTHTVSLKFDVASETIVPTASTVNEWLIGEESTPHQVEPNNAQGPVIEYRHGMFPEVGSAKEGSTDKSYNNLYGENTGINPDTYTNGSYWTTDDVYANELPYAKFEVANKGLNVDRTLNWRELQGKGKGENICAQTFGRAWRLPRLAEITLIMKNQTALATINGFERLPDGRHISATEGSELKMFAMNQYGIEIAVDKTEKYFVRCIKEIPDVTPTPPAIGDYYYSDKTYYPILIPTKTLLGIIYRVNPDGTGMLMDITEKAGVVWSTNKQETKTNNKDNGVANTTLIQALDPTFNTYPAFGFCASKNTGGINTGWYLPAINELKAFYAGFSGLRWVASEANTANGEINDWAEDDEMPGQATYVAQRKKLNDKLSVAGGTTIVDKLLPASNYWSSTENTGDYAYVIRTGNGVVVFVIKPITYHTDYRVRCVRAFTY